ncbi:MAG: hypothetical protein ACAI44_35915, partial [Candidatus Sericytochromatia bacterium]
LLSLVPLSACGGTANLAGSSYMSAAAQQPSSFSGQNAYMQPSYNYQAPEQGQPGMPQQAMAPQATRRPVTAAAPGSRPAPVLRPGTRTTPTLPVRQTAASAPVARPQAIAPAAPRPAAPSADSIGRELIAKTKEKFNHLQSFSVTGEAFEKNEKGETKIKLNLIFQKPGQIKLTIVQHNNAMYNGTKLTYMANQNSVTGRPGGALSFMKLTVPMTDDRILTRRGYRLDQVDTNAIVTRLLGNPALNPKILGKTNIGGHEIAVLEFLNVNTFDQRITRELLGIDMQDHFVRIHEMYEGANLVYSLKINQVTYDAPLSAADFEV